MAARVTENEQIEFLLSCIRHSNHGQVDFDQVVAECQVISKGAAAKRLSRLFQRYPVAKPGGNTTTPKPATGGEASDDTTTAGKKSGKGGSPAKKSSAGAGGAGPGGVTKKTTSPAKSRAKKGKTAKDPASSAENELLLNVKTEEPCETDMFGADMYNAGVDPVVFFESDA